MLNLYQTHQKNVADAVIETAEVEARRLKRQDAHDTAIISALDRKRAATHVLKKIDSQAQHNNLGPARQLF